MRELLGNPRGLRGVRCTFLCLWDTLLRKNLFYEFFVVFPTFLGLWGIKTFGPSWIKHFPTFLDHFQCNFHWKFDKFCFFYDFHGDFLIISIFSIFRRFFVQLLTYRLFYHAKNWNYPINFPRKFRNYPKLREKCTRKKFPVVNKNILRSERRKCLWCHAETHKSAGREKFEFNGFLSCRNKKKIKEILSSLKILKINKQFKKFLLNFSQLFIQNFQFQFACIAVRFALINRCQIHS